MTFHSSKRLWIVLTGLMAIAALMHAPLHAQSFYGSIVGTVTDSSGAVIPNANVTATNIGTNETRAGKSDSAGNFTFVNLVPADYKITVESASFKRLVRQPITVQVGSTTRVPLTLEVGAASETVQVTTEAPLLQTDSGSVNTLVTGTTVQEMPLNGRNTMNLIALSAGVVPQGASMGNTTTNQQGGNTSFTAWSNYQIGGGIAGQSTFYMDGAPLAIWGNVMPINPTQDAIQEFAVVSNSVGADFGRFGGGVVNMTTKSGSNAWHGSAYEYLRNSFVNANEWFNKRSQAMLGQPNKPPKWNQNQYGVVANGPIVRDKVFFLFTWEDFKSRKTTASPARVPTTNERAETSTGYAYIPQSASNTGSKALKDPLGRCNITSDGKGNWIIPFGTGSCVMDSAAAVMKNYWSLPTSGYSDSAGNNYYIAGPGGANMRQYNGRIDANLTANQRIFGRFTYMSTSDIGWNQFPDNTKYNRAGTGAQNSAQQAVLGDTYTVNPSTVVDVRLSFARMYAYGIPQARNVDQSQFGPAFATLGAQENVHFWPRVTLSTNPRNYFTSFGDGNANINHYNTYSISGNVTKILSNHSLKVGLETRRIENNFFGTNSSGSWAFSGNFTNDSWTDFLLGYAASSSLSSGNQTSEYSYYQAYYAQDTWTAMRDLTLTVGLRWELPGAISEKHNLATVLLPTTVDQYTGLTGSEFLVASPQYGSRSTLKSKMNLVAPRFGFAYRLGSSTAIRGGYGISYLPADMNFVSVYPAQSPINSAATSYTVQGTTPTAFLKDGLAVGNCGNNVVCKPSGRKDGSVVLNNSLLGQTLANPIPTAPYPYMQQWNLSVSRQFKGDWMLQAGYVGSKGTHLPAISSQNGNNATAVPPQDNQLDQQYWSLKTALTSTKDPSGNAIKIVTPAGQTVSGNWTYGQTLRPNKYFSKYGNSAPYWGATNYHSLQVTSVKRFKSGGVLTGAYTWAKMMGDTDSQTANLEFKSSTSDRTSGEGTIQNFNNHLAERSILSFNLPHRFVVSYVMPLPFGKGGRYGASATGAVSRIISGWAVNGITTFQSGFPLKLSSSATNNLTSNYGAGQLRPNVTLGCEKTVSGTTRERVASGKWFNTGCFPDPSDFTLGTEPRVDADLSSQGIDNWDFAVLKSTAITERSSIEFRSEFFNLFNRTQFAPPVIRTGTGFGAIQATAGNPRLVQFSMRLKF